MRGQRGMSTLGAVLLAGTAGLLTATLLTLLVVPVFYTFFDDAQLVTGRGIRHALGAPPEGERAEA